MEKQDFKLKQAIAVRIDLKMGKGKVATQVAHAAVSSAERARKNHCEWWAEWLNEGQCKVTLKVKNLLELLDLERAAAQMNLPFSLITDRGLTQIPPATVTCLGIGPAPATKIDKITGKLQLL
ncbi:MAG: peptidyl-tRNA hydrolase Pth2 [Candidatus Bathyarchaeota archaeon]|nr:peptidyl-tRNA hydrolase Pth2 [Candidatus Bathyarchaeota archaeon]